jgi:hypothetical protein
MPNIGPEEIENWFTYHTPDNVDASAYTALRAHAKDLALAIVNLTPPSADQSAAIRKLRECIMTANASIACKGK